MRYFFCFTFHFDAYAINFGDGGYMYRFAVDINAASNYSFREKWQL